MSKQDRKHPRHDIQIEVELSYTDDAPRTVRTRDISEGGMFLLLDDAGHYALGELARVAFHNPLANDRAEEKDAVVVRNSAHGIAIAFIEMEVF